MITAEVGEATTVNGLVIAKRGGPRAWIMDLQWKGGGDVYSVWVTQREMGEAYRFMADVPRGAFVEVLCRVDQAANGNDKLLRALEFTA